MYDLTDRRFEDIAKTSPALLQWWKKFKALAPHLADRVVNVEILIGDELPLPQGLRSSPAVSEDRDLVWFPNERPSKAIFLRMLTLSLWDLADSRYDDLAMGFIDRLLDQAVTVEHKRMLRFAERAADAVGEKGAAGLAQFGVYVRPPVVVAVRD